MKASKIDHKKTKSKGAMLKGNAVRPREFLEIMKRFELIDQEIKKEGELYDIKVKSLELEKEYLSSILNRKKK